MKPVVLMIPNLPARLLAQLAERYTVIGPAPDATPDRLPDGAREARALLTRGSMDTGAALMDALPALELVCCYGTGFEGVDIGHAAARGIAVTNAADANAASVAEYAMGLVLASVRGVVAADRFVRAGAWKGNSVERPPASPGLIGRRLGIYGLGEIGTRIAARAAGFEVEIGYHNRSPRPGVPYLYHDSLLGLARWCDVLVVSVRADAGNRGAVNAAVLEALGPQGTLVNISRGIALDQEAVCRALEDRVIAGAALDVFENEPEVPDRLRALGTAVLTPHIAANTAAAQTAQQAIMLANLESFFAGRPVPDLAGQPIGRTA